MKFLVHDFGEGSEATDHPYIIRRFSTKVCMGVVKPNEEIVIPEQPYELRI